MGLYFVKMGLYVYLGSLQTKNIIKGYVLSKQPLLEEHYTNH